MRLITHKWNGLDFQSIFPFRVGAYTAGNNIDITAPMNGKMAITQVYFRALSSGEVLQNSSKYRFGL